MDQFSSPVGKVCIRAKKCSARRCKILIPGVFPFFGLPHIFGVSPEKAIVGGQFWTDGYFVSTVGQHGKEETIGEYVKNQAREDEYRKLVDQQLSLFTYLLNSNTHTARITNHTPKAMQQNQSDDKEDKLVWLNP